LHQWQHAQNKITAKEEALFLRGRLDYCCKDKLSKSMDLQLTQFFQQTKNQGFILCLTLRACGICVPVNLFFADFLLGMQKTVSRHRAKSKLSNDTKLTNRDVI
jgi:hypothetical protein